MKRLIFKKGVSWYNIPYLAVKRNKMRSQMSSSTCSDRVWSTSRELELLRVFTLSKTLNTRLVCTKSRVPIDLPSNQCRCITSLLTSVSSTWSMPVCKSTCGMGTSRIRLRALRRDCSRRRLTSMSVSFRQTSCKWNNSTRAHNSGRFANSFLKLFLAVFSYFFLYFNL